MQDHRFVFYLVLLLATAIAWQIGQSQTPRELATLYENQQMTVLKQHYEKNQIADPDWREFVVALFEPDAELALKYFAQVHQTAKDKSLQRYALERVAEYYHARGYYKTSERLLNDRRFANQIISEHSQKKIEGAGRGEPAQQSSGDPQDSKGDSSVGVLTGSHYGVQVGAYSNYQNAIKVKNELLKITKNVTILEKESDNTKLYIVVIGGYSSREQAEREFQSIKRKKSINGFIIQY